MSKKKLISDRVASNVAQVIYDATVEAAGDRRSFITFYDFTMIVYQLVQQGLTPRAAHALRRNGLHDALVMVAALPKPHWSQRDLVSNIADEFDGNWRRVLQQVRCIHKRACDTAGEAMTTFLEERSAGLNQPAYTRQLNFGAFVRSLRPPRRPISGRRR